MALTREQISEATGFDQGDMFADEIEVLDYFTHENICWMFGACPYLTETLDEMAETVIGNHWHCAWELKLKE